MGNHHRRPAGMAHEAVGRVGIPSVSPRVPRAGDNRIAAIEDGITLRELIVEALRREVERRERERREPRPGHLGPRNPW